jgi:type IV secretory pathway VirB4 component
MMNLAEYRRRAQSLADFLPWAALVREGVILNKDGSFQRTARFRGPDLDSSTSSELVAIPTFSTGAADERFLSILRRKRESIQSVIRQKRL